MEHAAIAARIYAHLQELTGDLAALVHTQDTLVYASANAYPTDREFYCTAFGERWVMFGLDGAFRYCLQLGLGARHVLPHTLSFGDEEWASLVLAPEDQEHCADLLAALCEEKRQGRLWLDRRCPDP